MRLARLVVVTVALSFSALAVAQTPAELAALLPATLGAGSSRTDQTTYSSFATATYQLTDGSVIALQFHDVRGAGSEAYQRSTCPRFARIAGHEACVTPRSGGISLSWVFSDTLQVILGGAPDEATATRLAAALPLDRLAAMARAH